MILLVYLSIKFVAYAVITVLFTIFIGIKFIKFNSDLKKTEKQADYFKENPFEAKNFASQLNTLCFESSVDTELVHSKLSSLKYQKDFGSHTVYLCMELSRSSFLIVTLYEYLDTSKENSTEVLFKFNYRVNLNHTDGTLQFYSDEKMDDFFISRKKDFIKRFLYTQCGIEINVEQQPITTKT
jgi:hypothetical protein